MAQTIYCPTCTATSDNAGRVCGAPGSPACLLTQMSKAPVEPLAAQEPSMLAHFLHQIILNDGVEVVERNLAAAERMHKLGGAVNKELAAYIAPVEARCRKA